MTGAARQKPTGWVAFCVLMSALNLLQLAISDTARGRWYFAAVAVVFLVVAVVAYARPDLFTKK